MSTFVANARSNTTGTANYTVDLSAAGLQEGDVVLVVAGIVGTASGQNPQVTGYTQIGSTLTSPDTRVCHASAWYKVMGATPDTTVTVSASTTAGRGSSAQVQVWRGIDTASVLDVAATTATGVNASNPNSPSITPVTANAVVLSMVAGTVGSADLTVTPPTGYTNDQSSNGQSGSSGIVTAIASKIWTSGVAEDPAAWTNFTTSTNDSWCAFTVALKPASSGASAGMIFNCGVLFCGRLFGGRVIS